MPEPLEANLELSLTDALSSLDELSAATVESLTSAAQEGASAIESQLGAIPPLALDTDFSDAQSQLELFNAEASTPVVLPIDGDVEGATQQLDLFTNYVEANPPDPIPITVDTADAEEQISSLGDTASTASGDVSNLSGATDALGATTGLATGSTAGLGAAIGSTGGAAAVGVGVITGIAGATKAFYNEALEAAGATQRFEARLGSMASRVEELRDIEGLNSTLGELALNLGSDDDALRQVVATQYQLATGSGIANEKAAEYTETLATLAARAVALNPNLGAVDTTAQSLGTALSRGGRFASRFGLDLSSAEISAKALEQTGKSTASELTFVEKSMAGASIAAEKYGQNLQHDIAEGSENPIIQQRALKQAISENIEAAGAPLVMPILTLLEKGIPVFTTAGRVISLIAQAALPLLTIALEAVTPLLTAFADGLEALGPDVIAIVTIALTASRAFGLLHEALIVLNAAITANPWVALGIAVVTVVGALGLFNNTSEQSIKQTHEFKDAVVEASGAADEASLRAARSAFEQAHSLDELGKAGVGLTEVYAGLRGGTEKLSSGLRAQTADLQILRDSIGKDRQETEYMIGAIKAQDVALGTVLEKLYKQGQLTPEVIKTITRLNDQYDAATEKLDLYSAAGADAASITGSVTEAIAKNTDALIEHIKAEQAEVDAKLAQVDALTKYLDTLLAAQDKQFAATKAARDAAQAEKDLARTNEDATASELDKQIAVNTSIDAHEKAAIAAGEAAAATMVGASANDIAKGKIDATVNALDLQKSQVEYGGPVWKALDDYQRKIRDTPEYWLTHLDLVVSAFSGPGGAALANALGAKAGGAPSDVPFRAEGAVVPATLGGQLVRVAEAGHAEVILPTDDRARAIALLREAGMGDLLGSIPHPSAPTRSAASGFDYERLANVLGAGATGGAPLIGTAYIGERDTIATLDYFMKTRMGAGV